MLSRHNSICSLSVPGYALAMFSTVRTIVEIKLCGGLSGDAGGVKCNRWENTNVSSGGLGYCVKERPNFLHQCTQLRCLPEMPQINK
jgi:hypothetical protein